MGCCNCKTGGNQSGDDKTTERTKLIGNERGGPTPNRPISGEDGTRSVSSISKTDEQSMLNRILHKTASDIIDVSAIEPHSMEKAEYLERMRHYQERTTSRDIQTPRKTPTLPNTNAPMNVLAADPVNASDIQLITESSKNAAGAITSMKIKAKEPLVVPFGVEQTVTA